MAPRKPKPTDDDTSSTTSELPTVLKPKNEKAKVTKPKVEKPKVEKDKDKSKHEKPKAVKRDVKSDGKKDADVKGGDKGKDGKEKVKAVTGDEAVEVMKRYLKEQNRPYSATEVSANLHGKVCSPSLPPLDATGWDCRRLTDIGLEDGCR